MSAHEGSSSTVMAPVTLATPVKAYLSPILHKTPTVNVNVPSPASPQLQIQTTNTQASTSSPSQPQFAEYLTPLRLRPKRRRRQYQTLPTITPEVGLGGIQAGPSNHGYTTLDGDLFRGAASDPATWFPPPDNDDAITIGGSSSTSTSSSWSWGSGNLERGRRATMAVIERLGGRIGRRRGSGSSSDDSTSDAGRTSISGAHPRRRRLSTILTRTMSRGTVDSSPERPKRQYLPRRREFVLLLPPPPTGPTLGQQTMEGGDAEYQRVITTPSLPIILDKVRDLRQSTGYTVTPPEPTQSNTHPRPRARHHRSETAVAGGGSMGTRTRYARQRGPAASFIAPTPIRPLNVRARSRVEALREVNLPVRPKSVSDLMGLKNTISSSSGTSLSSLRDVEEDSPSQSSSPVTPTDRKGKGKQESCWWLDVSCPSWEDLRDLGELLGLHPLTLEDVLQQDPREKLDTFDSLGYYFIVARALDESYFKYTPGAPSSSLFAKSELSGADGLKSLAAAIAATTATATAPGLHGSGMAAAHSQSQGSNGSNPEVAKKEGRRRGWGMGRAAGKWAMEFKEKVEIIEDNPGKEGLEGIGVGAVNVYLAVFEDGIISFHFEDISKHTKRVLDRVLSLANDVHGSDWIAHGILDSIVDAFFPLIRYVDGEVDDIDTLTIDPTSDSIQSPPLGPTTRSPESSMTAVADIEMSEKISLDEAGNKVWKPPAILAKSATSHSPKAISKRIISHIPKLPRTTIQIPKALTYIKLFWLPITSGTPHHMETMTQPTLERVHMLKRMTNTRKLVTGLHRLLGGKRGVVGRLRKKFGEEGGGGGVEAYIGDLEDHILLLETSLTHYEYILSHCQPAYLSHLNVAFSYVRGGRDRSILALSTVTISVLPMQFVIGLFSMNVRVPHNGPQDQINYGDPVPGLVGHFYGFGGIIAGIVVISAIMVSVIRYWRYAARVKWARKSVHQREEIDPWDGYWGWR